MEFTHDVIADLESITAELATLRDLTEKHTDDLLEQRGVLIRRLLRTKFDPADERFASVLSHAARLQERLQKRCDSVRSELVCMEAAGTLMASVKSMLTESRKADLDIRA